MGIQRYIQEIIHSTLDSVVLFFGVIDYPIKCWGYIRNLCSHLIRHCSRHYTIHNDYKSTKIKYGIRWNVQAAECRGAPTIKDQIRVSDKEPVQVANQDLSLIPFQLKTTNLQDLDA